MDPYNIPPSLSASRQPHTRCEAVSDNEDMPSLDVLSFKQEPCTSLSCQCRVEQSRRDKNTNPSLPPFSFPTTGLHPTLKRPLTGSSGYVASSSTNAPYSRLVSPPVFGAPVYTSTLVTNSSSSERLAKEKRLDVTNSILFGAEHYDRADFRSFSQLGGGPYPVAAAPSAESSEAFTRGQLHSFDARSSSCNNSLARELDLRDLQSVLEDSIEASPGDQGASGPLHLQPPSSSGTVQPGTCAQQAAKFDDWTGDELAGYFDDFCYIPKKMSAMAEMMYM